VSATASRDAAAAFEARATWESGLAATALALIAALDRLVSETDPSRAEMILRLATIAYLVGLAALLVARRERPNVSLSLFAWTTAIAAYSVMLPFLAQRWVATHRPYEPMLRQALVMVLAGAFAPARFLFGMVPIVLLLAEAAFEYWQLDLRHNPILWFGTPGRVALYGAVAAVLAYRRARALQRERALVEREQEALALERLARVAMAVHDTTNNALQTLMVSAHLLKTDPTQSDRVAPAMLRAVEKLKTVNDAFGAYKRQVDWRPGDESFDAAEVLASGGAPPTGDRAAGAAPRRPVPGG